MKWRSYTKWKLDDLKAELRRRNARVTGRKKELIDRLEAYDRNENFGGSGKVHADADDWHMQLPAPQTFRDLTTKDKLPVISGDTVTAFLNHYGESLDATARELYTARYLQFVRCSYTDHYYFTSRCKAEMKKTVAYDVHLCINNSGVVLSTECECAAGMGPQAHCKHIRALLVGLVNFCSGQQLLVAVSCTDKLQTFHRPKQHHSGSPVKAHCLSLCGVKPTHILFDPTPLEFTETAEQINRRVRNEAINYAAASKQTMQLLQTFSPANTYGINNDHDYMDISPAEQFLQCSNISSISVEEAADVEVHTRGQANSRLWHVERCKRLHSSNFRRIVMATYRTDFDKLAMQFLNPKDISSKPLQHGRQYESVALSKYETLKSVKVRKCGIIVDLDRPYLGCSPDGLVGTERIVEVKCPYTAVNKLVSPETVPYLELDEQTGLYRLKADHPYMYQIQGLLHITGRSVCDLLCLLLVTFR